MIGKQRIWMKKVTSLMDYMHYEWETDSNWKSFYESKQANRKGAVKLEDKALKR